MSVSLVTDTIYTYRFLKLLVTPFEKTKAYELGIVDENGERTDKQITTSEERDAFNLFHRLVFNIKRLNASLSSDVVICLSVRLPFSSTIPNS